MRWEYKEVLSDYETDQEDFLNNLGRSGWEVVSRTEYPSEDNWTQVRYLLKRQWSGEPFSTGPK